MRYGLGKVRAAILTAVATTGLVCAPLQAAEAEDTPRPTGERTIRVRVSWGHTSRGDTPFHVRCLATGATIAEAVPQEMEPGETPREGAWKTRAGGGDVDAVTLALRCPDTPVRPRESLNVIWRDLIARSDADTARRLREDPGLRPDPRRLTVEMDPAGLRGFSLTVDQMRRHRAFRVPALDVYVAVGDAPPSFEEHQKELAAWKGKRILDRVATEPEATYGAWTDRWEDMGSPAYRHPSQPAPGHVVGLTWDSAIPKFGIDRGAGVWPDYGNPDRFRLEFDFGDLGPELVKTWKGQRLEDGLPIVTTTIERDGIRWDVEQFAYPLHGPPPERRGDIAMVLLSKVKATDLAGKARTVDLVLRHRREHPAGGSLVPEARTGPAGLTLEGGAALLLSVRGDGVALNGCDVKDAPTKPDDAKAPWAAEGTLALAVDLAAGGSRELIITLPSPAAPAAERARLLALDYDRCRAETVRFWSDWFDRGARFHVPDPAVNALFRASLWHALRLPRRRGGGPGDVRIDLPYSNFAYEQRGIPWPINQAVYVDYMLYDLRGYHDVAAEELLAIYREKQEPSGRVGGYANWTVYTPGMIYAVAQNYLLSQGRAAFERLLPPTLKALDWCQGEIAKSRAAGGDAAGLVRGPLNDLTGDGVWAFSQAYVYAALDLLGRALEDAGHPRAAECRQAAAAFRRDVERGFARASVLCPLVQLRDHTWSPYVPCEATRRGRAMDQWYPTEVDTGAVHLVRLKALDPRGPLAGYLLNDHEDNLFLHGWGMANEPVYNMQATAYLRRDEPKAAIRAFYSMMACAFSHSVFEPVEHRWTWGQYFGPPSTDGSWFELYRRMLIHERDDGTLALLAATPRKWLQDGRKIEVERAPTWYGRLSMTVESRAATGEIRADVRLQGRRPPKALLVRLRHPRGKPLRGATVNGNEWPDVDPAKEWIRIANPVEERHEIVGHY
jgi:hypothetical protein